jgi:holo-[acyl-carrier protein] synthase
MIKGIGTDIVQIDRIEVSVAKRILTEKEQAIFAEFPLPKRQREWLAGRFAAKEAIIKALSVASNVIGLRDIEILPDEHGKPIATCPKAGNVKIDLSIAHEHDYAVAFCVVSEPTL